MHTEGTHSIEHLLHSIVVDSAHSEAVLREQSETLRSMLSTKGALLVRGLDSASRDDFLTALKAIFGDAVLRPYHGGVGFKKDLGSAVYSSTEVPKSMEISPHQEMAYLPSPPDHIAFFCHKAASAGGCTPLLCGQQLAEQIDPDIRAAFEERGVTYTRLYWAGGLGDANPLWMTWPKVFGSEDPREVEKRCASLGLDYAWKPQRRLQTRVTLPGVKRHPRTQQVVWSNQAHTFVPRPAQLGWGKYLMFRLAWAWPALRQATAEFGDNTPIPGEMIDRIHTQMDAIKATFQWEAGDLLVLDNHRMLHGREPYRGTREIWTALF